MLAGKPGKSYMLVACPLPWRRHDERCDKRSQCLERLCAIVSGWRTIGLISATLGLLAALEAGCVGT